MKATFTPTGISIPGLDKLKMLMALKSAFTDARAALAAKDYDKLGDAIQGALNALNMLELGTHINAVLDGFEVASKNGNYRELYNQVLVHVLTPLAQFVPDGSGTPTAPFTIPAIRIGTVRISGAAAPATPEDAVIQVLDSAIATIDNMVPANGPTGFGISDLSTLNFSDVMGLMQLGYTIFQAVTEWYNGRPKPPTP